MDSLTHLALGAVTGEVLLGKDLGRKAFTLGALANSYPDIDALATLWLSPAENIIAHRGITHSVLFSLLSALLFSFLFSSIIKSSTLPFKRWLWFFAIQIGLHLFIDAFNAYGTGWFEPFSDYRVNFNTLFVVDPFFSTPLLVVAISLLWGSPEATRKKWAIVGLIITSSYLGYAIINKSLININVEQSLAEDGMRGNRYFTTPTPFNTWVWLIAIESDSGYFTGYQSVFQRESTISYAFHPRHDSLLREIADQSLINDLKDYANGFYVASRNRDTTSINILQFGQIAGWQNSRSPFVMELKLKPPETDHGALQRRRLSGWTRESLKALIEKIY